jgi:hypothetical protein
MKRINGLKTNFAPLFDIDWRGLWLDVALGLGT